MKSFNEDITISGQIFTTADVANLDVCYGPYNSVAEALNTLDEYGKLEADGLTVGIFEAGKLVEYYVKNKNLTKKINYRADNNTIEINGELIKVRDNKFVPYVRKINGIELGAADVELTGANIKVKNQSQNFGANNDDVQYLNDALDTKQHVIDDEHKVEAKFIESTVPGGGTIDEALVREVTRATTKETELNAKIDTENARAVAAETAENTRATAAEANLQQDIADEATARQNADTVEISARQSADTALQANIDQEKVDRQAADANLQTNIDAEVSSRELAVNNEKTRAEGVESGLNTRISAIESDYLKQADKTELEGKITAEETRAEDIEAGLRTDVDNKINLLGNEPGSGEAYHIPYNFNAPEYTEEGLNCTFDTITLDNNSTKKSYTISLNKATDTTAGLMSKADKVELAQVRTDLTSETAARTSEDVRILTESKEYTDAECAKKVDLPNEPISGQGVNVPYYFSVDYEADKVKVTDYTIDLLDKEKATQQFSLDINGATETTAGLLTANDKTKLDGIETGAQVNVVEHIKVADIEQTPTDKTISIPAASSTNYGVVKTDASIGTKISSSWIGIVNADDTNINSRTGYNTNGYGVISTANYDSAVKHALCDAPGTTGSKNPEYTADEKQAASKRILPAIENSKYLHTAADGNLEWSDLPSASSTVAGLVKIDDTLNYGQSAACIGINSDGKLIIPTIRQDIDQYSISKKLFGSQSYNGTPRLMAATETEIAGRTPGAALTNESVYNNKPIVPNTLDYAVKAALTDAKKITYTADEKQAASKTILPTINSGDAGKFLAVNSTGDGVEWKVGGTKLYKHMLSNNNDNTYFIVITTSSTAITWNEAGGYSIQGTLVSIAKLYAGGSYTFYNCQGQTEASGPIGSLLVTINYMDAGAPNSFGLVSGYTDTVTAI